MAENDYNIPAIIKEGGYQTLESAQLVIQQSKDCVAKTLKRLNEKLSPKSVEPGETSGRPETAPALLRTLQAFRAGSTSRV